ncbi:MAG: hypothetical protein SV375_20525 [Thermodesulfobacteriota bacterium]|nr:hypothetical protein [Thermodesulfobacteriota bacterium]
MFISFPCSVQKILCVLFIFSINSCISLSENAKLYPLPESGVYVKGDKIYHNDKPFAELRYFIDHLADNIMGFGIFYYTYNKEVWISPKKGCIFQKGDKKYYKISEIDRAWKKDRYFKFLIWERDKQINKDDIITSWCSNIRISEDAKYVYYVKEGLIFDSSWAYLVEYGISKKKE